MAQTFLTPPGRLVQGSCFEAQKTDAEGNQLVIRNGPNAGKPRVDYFMALAIPKTDPGWAELYAKIHQTAKEGFPNYFDGQGNCILPTFAFKVTDGDSQVPNTRGTKPYDREGYPGHWVLSFSGGFAPRCHSRGGEAVLTDPASIKRGDYIRIYGSVASNESSQRPGIYLNHSMVELVGYGQEIVTGPDGHAVFGGAPVSALPAGASATPLAPATVIAPQMRAPAPQMQAPAPQMQAPAPQMQNVQPATDFLNGPTPTPTPTAPLVVKYQTQDGGTWTHEQLIGYNFTPEMIAALPTA